MKITIEFDTEDENDAHDYKICAQYYEMWAALVDIRDEFRRIAKYTDVEKINCEEAYEKIGEIISDNNVKFL